MVALPARRSPPWLPVALVWAILAACLLWRGWAFVRTGDTPDPDAITRMMQVRDLLGGQGWFDLHQYRFGPAGNGGVLMHWSRIGDLLPAALTLALTPVAGQPRALILAQAATPLLLLLPVVALAFAVTRALVPPGSDRRRADVPLAITLFVTLASVTLFVPGNVDHHNLQLLALLLLLWGTCARPTAAMGAVAGVAVTLAMTIGLETAPHVGAVLGVVALRWVVAPVRERDFIRGLGLGQMASAIVSLGVFMPRPWPSGQCDSWTPAVFWLVLGSAALFTVAGAREWPGRVARIALLGTGAVALIGAIAYAYPACLHHPAGTDPLLWRYWMDGISENEPVLAMASRHDWASVLLYLESGPLVLVIGLGVAVAAALRSGDTGGGSSRAWWPPLAACAAALAITLLHVRGHSILWAISAMLAAALIARARDHGGWRLVAAWTLLPPLGTILLAAMLTPPRSSVAESPVTDLKSICYAPAVIAALDRLEPTTLVVPIGTEPMILSRTRHRSLGATYHRDARGDHLLIGAMIAPPDAARAPIVAGGARYLLSCPGDDGARVYRRGSPHGLAAALAAHTPPPWLRPIARLPAGVRLYAVE